MSIASLGGIGLQALGGLATWGQSQQIYEDEKKRRKRAEDILMNNYGGTDTIPGTHGQLQQANEQYTSDMGSMAGLPGYEGSPLNVLDPYRAARTSMDERYSGLADAYGARRGTVMEMLSNYGESERANTNADFNALRGSSTARLASRGLSGTSAVGSTLQGVERERQRAMNALNERIDTTKANAYSQLEGDKLGVYGEANRALSAADQSIAGINQGLIGNYAGSKREGAYSNVGHQEANAQSMVNLLGSYTDHPPDTSWISGIGTGLLQYDASRREAEAAARANDPWRQWGQNALTLGTAAFLFG